MIRAYWANIFAAISTSYLGLSATIRHFFSATKSAKPVAVSSPDYFAEQQGLMTLQYPHESFPVPDNGRYKLHNEIDDCIVCDKCAKICPVDCIDIEPIRAVKTFGETSDGTPKRIYAAKFDIDMGKCCFCGLCTTVCPTECLTMTKSFDFSEYDVANHKFSFATMTDQEIAEKKKELADVEQQKMAAKTQAATATEKEAQPKKAAKPMMKPKLPSSPASAEAKPKFRPRPMIKKKKKDDDGDS